MNQKEINVRFSVPEDMHDRVRKVQGLFTFKEGKHISVQETYRKLVDRGIREILKNNK